MFLPFKLRIVSAFFLSAYNSVSPSPPLLKKETLNEMLLPGNVNMCNHHSSLVISFIILQCSSILEDSLSLELPGKCIRLMTNLSGLREATSLDTLLCSASYLTFSQVGQHKWWLPIGLTLFVGVNALWSGGADGKTSYVTGDIYNILLPAFVDALSPVQVKVQLQCS